MRKSKIVQKVTQKLDLYVAPFLGRGDYGGLRITNWAKELFVKEELIGVEWQLMFDVPINPLPKQPDRQSGQSIALFYDTEKNTFEYSVWDDGFNIQEREEPSLEQAIADTKTEIGRIPALMEFYRQKYRE